MGVLSIDPSPIIGTRVHCRDDKVHVPDEDMVLFTKEAADRFAHELGCTLMNRQGCGPHKVKTYRAYLRPELMT